MIDIVMTQIVIYGDQNYLYIKPCQPISFKKRYKFKRTEIKKTRVDTKTKRTRHGLSRWHDVVLVTNDNNEHIVLTARDKREGLVVRKELKKWRIYV